MVAFPTPLRLALAERLYHLALLSYPTKFRRAYGLEMVQTFRDASREILRDEGNGGLLWLYAHTFSDLVATSSKEHIKSLGRLLSQLIGNQPEAGLDALFLTAPLRLQIAQETDIGCVRRTNEDNLLTVLPDDPAVLKQKGALFVVADGMGGHLQGDRASLLAVNMVRESYYQSEDEDIAVSLVQAIKQASACIYAENLENHLQIDTKCDMGTTCIAAVLQEHDLVVANVGDSRVYIVHDGQLRQVSRDHSLVADMVLAGQITAEEARHHVQRNIIYRSLGTQEEVEVDVFSETVSEGDALVLCTDGLSSLLTEDEILQTVETYELQESVQQLIARARSAGGSDNITAIVVRVEQP